jgi:hypothetical protein
MCKVIEIFLNAENFNCNPSYLRGRSRKMKVQGQPGKTMRPYLKNKTQ